eukprot:12896808-Prorocentrum_lima.AAC.1
MSNFVWVGPQKDKTQEETIGTLLRRKGKLMMNPKTVVSDKYFNEQKLRQLDTFSWHSLSSFRTND